MKLLLLACLLLLSLCVVHSKAASLPGMATRRRYTESNRLRGGVEPQQPPLHVSVVSWNMAEKVPTEDACSFIKLHQSDDIVVFGIQECEDIRPRRNEGHRSRKWRSLQSRLLGRSFRCMARHKMGGLLIAVYVKKSVMKEVEGLQVLDVACGVGNVLSNKGAVSVVLRIRDKTVAFINSHLAAHQKYVKKRNSDYKRIMEVVLESIAPEWTSSKKVLREKLDGADYHIPVIGLERPLKLGRKISPLKQMTSSLSTQSKKAYKTASSAPSHKRGPTVSRSLKENEIPVDAVMFFGDLNYRVEQPRAVIERLHKQLIKSSTTNKKASSQTTANEQAFNKTNIQNIYFQDTAPVERALLEKKLDRLLRFDQLNLQRRFGKVFQGFQEGSIRFPPTYKYDKGANLFDTSEKQRCPAWTDRILFYSKPVDVPSSQTSPPSKSALNSAQQLSAGLGDDQKSLVSAQSKNSLDVTPTVSEKESQGEGRERSTPDVPKAVVELLDYYSVDARTSDHRPVCATFRLHL